MKYRIKALNIYNMDEKNFLIGICGIMKHIVSKKNLKNKNYLMHVKMDLANLFHY